MSLPPSLDWRMPQRIVSVRRPAPLHLQKLVEARKPRVPPSELPRAGATGIGFFPSPTAVSVEHGSRFAHIPYSPIHKAQNSPRLSYQRLEERGSSQTDKLAVSFDAPAWTQIDNVKILSPSHPTRHRRAPASCRPGGVSVIAALPLYYESKDMLVEDTLYTESPISPRRETEPVLSALDLEEGHEQKPSPSGTPRPRKGRPSNKLYLREVDKLSNFTPSPPISPNKFNRRKFFPNSPKSPNGQRRVHHLEFSRDEKSLMKKGYTIEQLRPPEKHILGPLLRDKQHYMVYRQLHGPDNAAQHNRYSHRCDRRHVKDTEHGRRSSYLEAAFRRGPRLLLPL